MFLTPMPEIHGSYVDGAQVVYSNEAVPSGLRALPDGAVKLIVSSPPYNIGKDYEKKIDLDAYLANFEETIDALCRVLHPNGSLCWQVGNFVEKSEVFPLDIYFYPLFRRRGLKLRNRIIWRFNHGLHCTKRLSGRYETILWFTKGDSYTFNLDPIRVPSKYPGKLHYKGPKKGLPSGNPLGKNPSDVWDIVQQDWESEVWEIPNVKSNHPEKTNHPCQFPVELVQRCVLALTNGGDLVLDPYAGVGSTLLAALLHERRAIGFDTNKEYLAEGMSRIKRFYRGDLKIRPIGKPIHQPSGREKVAKVPAEWRTSTSGSLF